MPYLILKENCLMRLESEFNPSFSCNKASSFPPGHPDFQSLSYFSVLFLTGAMKMFQSPATVPRISQISSLCGNFHCLGKKSVFVFLF